MDTGSVNSVPSSVSGSSARSTPVPSHYKPLTQSSSILALTKSPDEEIKRKSPDELVHILRRLESENRNLVGDHGNIMKDVNKKMQILLLEVRGLKDINQSLQDDNQELRDLCCFLDDDRQRGRKLAREWQRFGRYTASVMRSEVSAYQEKLRELEGKQQELMADNVELKELCLYLDTERLRAGQTRDDGDGSSNSTVAGGDELDGVDLVPVSQLQGNYTTGTSDYVRHLEDKVKQLEEEKKNISQQLGRSSDSGVPTSPSDGRDPKVPGNSRRLGPDGDQQEDSASRSPNPNKPEAVVHAMKVLEVHENLERPVTSVGEDNLDDKEKAIVREMCNVVWRKLGNVSSEGDSEHSTPHPVYENIQPTRSRSTPPEPIPRAGQDRPPDQHAPHTSQALPQDPGIGLEPMPVYTAQPVQPQPHRSEPNLHTAATSQYSRSDTRQPDQGASSPYPRSEGRRSDHSQRQHSSDSRQPLQQQATSQPQRLPGGQGSSQGQPGPPLPNPHYSIQAPKYGYVRTTRSTPVTPIPPLRTHSPVPSAPSTPSHNLQPDRSGSKPRSVVQGSQSPGPQRSLQFPRNDSQSSVHLYQNQPPLPGQGDNSYENIPHNYYYVTSAKAPTSTSDSAQPSRGPGYDYTSGPQNQSAPRISYSESNPRPNPGNQSRSHTAPAPPPPSSSQGQQHQQYTSHPHYQNVQFQNPQNLQGGKKTVRDPSPQGPRGPPYRQPQSTQPAPPQYSQQYPSRSVSVSSSGGPPPQSHSQSGGHPHSHSQPGAPTSSYSQSGGAPPSHSQAGGQYGGRQGGYPPDYLEERGGQAYPGRQQDGRGRRDGNQYYH